MPEKKSFRSAARFASVFIVGAMFFLPLSACDLAKNSLKVDRSGDKEVQDYRDSMAERLPDISNKVAEDDSIPELKPYMATPSDKLKPMPLVSISVNQTVPLKDVLYELAQQAGYDMELDPRIKGSIIFSVRNKPFDEVIDRLSESAGLRYKFDGDSVRVELDTPYHQIYKISYLSYIRKNDSSISNNVAVVSGDGADTGSKFSSQSKSEADFWGELSTNLTQIIGGNREAGTLRTKKDPKITAVSESPAPVEPVLLTADGDITENKAGESADPAKAGEAAKVNPPEAVLKVEPLPVEEEEAGASASNEDPYQPRFSVNKQAGMISVYATERLHKEVSKYLDMLKTSVTAQVLIEAKVLQVSLSDEFSAGIDWSATNLFRDHVSIATSNIGDSLAPAFTPPEQSLSLAAAITSGDFSLAIEALQRFGTVHALSSPRLTVLNNQTAVLNVAKNKVYFEIKIDTSTSDAGTTSVEIESQIRNVPEGVLINVQPSIDLDNETISMAVRPTVTRVDEWIPDPGVAFAIADAGIDEIEASEVPVVDVQEFDSVLKMNNGQAIVMGGLIQDRSDSTQVAVPVLGEIPVVGGLFRNQADKVSKTELVILLKSTIVEGGNNIHQTDKDLYRSFSQDRRPFDL